MALTKKLRHHDTLVPKSDFQWFPPQCDLYLTIGFSPFIAAQSLCRLHKVLFKPVLEATVLITTDAAAFHEPHTLSKPMELLGNAFLTCMIMSAERVNHGRYSIPVAGYQGGLGDFGWHKLAGYDSLSPSSVIRGPRCRAATQVSETTWPRFASDS